MVFVSAPFFRATLLMVGEFALIGVVFIGKGGGEVGGGGGGEGGGGGGGDWGDRGGDLDSSATGPPYTLTMVASSPNEDVELRFSTPSRPCSA